MNNFNGRRVLALLDVDLRDRRGDGSSDALGWLDALEAHGGTLAIRCWRLGRLDRLERVLRQRYIQPVDANVVLAGPKQPDLLGRWATWYAPPDDKPAAPWPSHIRRIHGRADPAPPRRPVCPSLRQLVTDPTIRCALPGRDRSNWPLDISGVLGDGAFHVRKAYGTGNADAPGADGIAPVYEGSAVSEDPMIPHGTVAYQHAGRAGEWYGGHKRTNIGDRFDSLPRRGKFNEWSAEDPKAGFAHEAPDTKIPPPIGYAGKQTWDFADGIIGRRRSKPSESYLAGRMWTHLCERLNDNPEDRGYLLRDVTTEAVRGVFHAAGHTLTEIDAALAPRPRGRPRIENGPLEDETPEDRKRRLDRERQRRHRDKIAACV